MNELRIGHLSTVYHTSLVLMGTQNEIKIAWKLFGSGVSIVRALDKKEIDIGYAGLTPVIIGIDKNIPIKCIAGGHMEGTVMIGSSSFKSLEESGSVKAVLEQFKNATLGAPPKGSMHDIIIRHLLDKLGLENKIEVKNFEWADFILEEMEKGEIHAAVGTPALAVAASRSIGARIVIPSGKLWPNNPSYGIIVRSELIENSPKLLEKFLKLHEDASNLIRTNPEKAAEIVSSVVEIIDGDFVLQAYKISPKYCAALPKKFISSTMAFIPVLCKLKYISKTLTERDIFESRFIRKAHPEPSHYFS